jgi:hypothetical protein
MRHLASAALWVIGLLIGRVQPKSNRSGLLDESLVAPFAEYAKERFLSIETQIKEFRNSSRQLASALTVVIGLELTVLFKVASDYPHSAGWWHAIGVFLMIAAFIIQFVALILLIRDGFTTTPVLGPEAPTVLRRCLSDMPVDAASETFANYYANGYDQYFELQAHLGTRVRRSAYSLIISLLLFVIGIVGILRFNGVQKKQFPSRVRSLIPSSSATRRPPPMAEKATPTPPAKSSPTPPTKSTPTPPMKQALPTPTPGQIRTATRDKPKGSKNPK